MKDTVGLVHQMPFVCDRPGLPSTLEQVGHLHSTSERANRLAAVAVPVRMLNFGIARGKVFLSPFSPGVRKRKNVAIASSLDPGVRIWVSLSNFCGSPHHYVCMNLALRRRPKGNRPTSDMGYQDAGSHHEKVGESASCRNPSDPAARAGVVRVQTSSFPPHAVSNFRVTRSLNGA